MFYICNPTNKLCLENTLEEMLLRRKNSWKEGNK